MTRSLIYNGKGMAIHDEYIWREIVRYLPDAVDRANLRETCRMLARVVARPEISKHTIRQYVVRGRDPCGALIYRRKDGSQIHSPYFDDIMDNMNIYNLRVRIARIVGFNAVFAPPHVWRKICEISTREGTELNMIRAVNVLREVWAGTRIDAECDSMLTIGNVVYAFSQTEERRIFIDHTIRIIPHMEDEYILRAIEFAENMSFSWQELRNAIGFPRETSPKMIFALSRAILGRSKSEIWRLWEQWDRARTHYNNWLMCAHRIERAKIAARKHVRFNEDIAFSAQQLRNMRAMRDQRFIRAAMDAIRRGVFRTIVRQMTYDLDIAREVSQCMTSI